MQSEVDFSKIEQHAHSLESLISVLLHLFPDSPEDRFDHDAYLAVLCKASEDSTAINVLLRNQPDKVALPPHQTGEGQAINGGFCLALATSAFSAR
jgi:hypothetical protein